MVRFLLRSGAAVDSSTNAGYTPLHQAAQQGHTLVINLLLESKAKPNAVTNVSFILSIRVLKFYNSLWRNAITCEMWFLTERTNCPGHRTKAWLHKRDWNTEGCHRNCHHDNSHGHHRGEIQSPSARIHAGDIYERQRRRRRWVHILCLREISLLFSYMYILYVLLLLLFSIKAANWDRANCYKNNFLRYRLNYFLTKNV